MRVRRLEDQLRRWLASPGSIQKVSAALTDGKFTVGSKLTKLHSEMIGK